MLIDEAKKILQAEIYKLSPLAQETAKIILSKPVLRVEYPDELHATFDGKIYRLQTNGYYERREYLHTAVMEYYSGEKIPAGYVVHHAKKNEKGEYDKSQNDIEDLLLLTASEHQKIHGYDLKTPHEREFLNCGKKIFNLQAQIKKFFF